MCLYLKKNLVSQTILVLKNGYYIFDKVYNLFALFFIYIALDYIYIIITLTKKLLYKYL